LKIDWLKINALVPCQDAETGGNFTRVLLAGAGEIMEKRRVAGVIRAIGIHFQVDQAAARKWAGEYLGKKKWLPLVFHRELALVPLRLRRSPFRDAGATGYINLIRVAGCTQAQVPGYLSEIQFKDGSILPCLNAKGYVQRMLRQAGQVRERYLILHYGPVQGEDGLLPPELLGDAKGWIIVIPRQGRNFS
jgi:hypothetical protein